MIFFLFDDKTEPADIFAEIPSEKSPNVPPQSPEAGSPLAQATATGVVMQQASFGKKGVLILALAVIVIGGGATAYLSLRGSKAPTEPTVQIPEPQQQVPEPQPEPLQPQPEHQPQPQPEVDSDGDGLSDVREGQLGTNAGMVDTDNDGLSDREEAEVYMTDPNNADTDADTYKDGDEVRNGYNPKGAGKLLEIPPAP